MFAGTLTALALVLAAAVGLGLAMSRMRMPAAAGFILVGVALGPSGAGLVSTSHDIETLAELGVLMLLFIIGMELRLASFSASLPLALGVTAANVVVIGSSVGLFAWAVDGEVMGGVIIGFMLSISSTAVAMKMILDANEKETQAGRVAVAVLVAQDLAVVPLLLVTNALGKMPTGMELTLIILRLVLAVALLVGFIGILTRVKSFRFPGSDSILKDFDVASLTVLGLCFASASLSGLLGLSPALGAFLGGLAVGHSTLRHGALEMAQPVQSILLFVFFLSVGLLIDLKYLIEQIWVIAAALVVVTGGKTVLNFILLVMGGEKLDTAFSASLFLSPVGEFSFVIAGAALSVHALSAEGHKLAIAVIAMSLLVSPLWFLAARLVHRLAPHIRISLGPLKFGMSAPGRPDPGE